MSRCSCTASARSQAYNMVAIKSRVDGQIVKVDFKEGQDVKAGRSALANRPAALPGGARAGAGRQAKGRGAARGRPSSISTAMSSSSASGLPDPAELRPAKGAGRPAAGLDQGRRGADQYRQAQPRLHRHPLADRRAARRAARRQGQSGARDRQHRARHDHGGEADLCQLYAAAGDARRYPREPKARRRSSCWPIAATARSSSPRAS